MSNVTVSNDSLSVALSDGRTITVPLGWFPRLTYGSQAEQANWRMTSQGHGIHWDDLDAEISVEGLLAGMPSGESPASLKSWLARRLSQMPVF